MERKTPADSQGCGFLRNWFNVLIKNVVLFSGNWIALTFWPFCYFCNLLEISALLLISSFCLTVCTTWSPQKVGAWSFFSLNYVCFIKLTRDLGNLDRPWNNRNCPNDQIVRKKTVQAKLPPVPSIYVQIETKTDMEKEIPRFHAKIDVF